ncbi:unnamed protein product [Brassica rapa]|uniref:Uncharacterized protein n=3 Tax=Brassica TaxID=3705 RepID=A0A3P5ZMB5_BRACM|nr:unnamed protein product [Brassica napus]CAG7878282.1 unnamed protein product [Brassica rapa]CDY27719.1 BnaA05g31280D [Brassica napus]VDC73208.1 unnamed protein product [Brassica rapa]
MTDLWFGSVLFGIGGLKIRMRSRRWTIEALRRKGPCGEEVSDCCGLNLRIRWVRSFSIRRVPEKQLSVSSSPTLFRRLGHDVVPCDACLLDGWVSTRVDAW